MPFQWDVTPGQAFDELFQNYTKTLFATGGRVMTRRGEEMKTWMKDNAPWTDRTGQARAGLDVDMEQNPGTIGQLIPHHGEGIDHGLWLEIAYGGKWGIINKTIDYWGPVVMRDMQRICNLGLAALDRE